MRLTHRGGLVGVLVLGLVLTQIGACGVRAVDAVDATDADSDSDTDSVETMVVSEHYWDALGQCWKQRELVRPVAYWGEAWAADFSGNGCSTLLDYGCDIEDPPTDECPPKFFPYTSEDGLCTRWFNDAINAPACALTDPWVRPCDAVEGCCDLFRANNLNWCK